MKCFIRAFLRALLWCVVGMTLVLLSIAGSLWLSTFLYGHDNMGAAIWFCFLFFVACPAVYAWAECEGNWS